MTNIYKNMADQYLSFYAYDPITGSGVTGAEGTFYMRVWRDDNTTSSLANSASGLNQIYFPGQYVCPLNQSETNYDLFIVNPQSASGNIVTDIISVYTTTASGTGGGGGGASAADIADAVWDEAFSGHTTTNTFGEFLNRVANSGVTVSGLAYTNYLAGLTDLAQEFVDEGYISASITDVSLTPLNQIAQYVWRDIVSENQNTSGSFAELLARISGSGVNLSGWRGSQPDTYDNGIPSNIIAINGDTNAAGGFEKMGADYDASAWIRSNITHIDSKTLGTDLAAMVATGVNLSGWRGIQPLTLSNQRVRVNVETVNGEVGAAAGLEAAGVEYNDNGHLFANVVSFNNGVIDDGAVDSTFTNLIAAGVWDRNQAGSQSANTFGKLVGQIAVSGVNVSGWRGLQPRVLTTGLIQSDIMGVFGNQSAAQGLSLAGDQYISTAYFGSNVIAIDGDTDLSTNLRAIVTTGVNVSGWLGQQPGPLVGASGLVQAHIVDMNSDVTITSSISSNDLSNIADRVWDEMLNEHRDVGSASAFLRTRSFDGWSQ